MPGTALLSALDHAGREPWHVSHWLFGMLALIACVAVGMTGAWAGDTAVFAAALVVAGGLFFGMLMCWWRQECEFALSLYADETTWEDTVR